MLKDARSLLLSHAEPLIEQWRNFARPYAATPMLARTHGQAATPTTFGKEIANIIARLVRTLDDWQAAPVLGKFNGATGSFNAHKVSYPEVDWPSVSQDFIRSLGLEPNTHTTQIEPHDYIAAFNTRLALFNNVMIDFNRDIWYYVSLGYLKQRAVEGEVGSSTMPHKVNPIDFENSEGNFTLANGVLITLANRLPQSRFQRDLIDSTLMRNLGVGLGHTMIGLASQAKGLAKLAVDETKLAADLESNWEVLGEAIQTVMRRYGIEQPYEKLKALTRGKRVDAEQLAVFIDTLSLPEPVKKQLKELTPASYIGYAKQLAEEILLG